MNSSLGALTAPVRADSSTSSAPAAPASSTAPDSGAPDSTALDSMAPGSIAGTPAQGAHRTRDRPESEASFDARLRILVEATAASLGDQFFRDLVRTLAELFEVRWTLVGEQIGTSIRSIALWDTDDFVGELQYPLAGSPCADVVGRQNICAHVEGVAARFPDDPMLRELGVESYLGIPLLDRGGELLGLMVLMHDRPSRLPEGDQELLRLFSARVAAEVARHRAEREKGRLESRVLHAQKLESLGVLAGGVAHDFNNHLAVILGNLGLVRMALPEGTPVCGYLDEAERAVQRSADLTQQMLAYSGKGRTVVAPLDLSALVAGMSSLLRSLAGENARLELDLAPSLPEIEGDGVQLRQLLSNLVANAAESFSAVGRVVDGGTVRVRTDRIWVDRELLADAFYGEPLDEGPYVMLEVADDGCGMGDETQERLFDPFFSTKQTGRGLGMATVLGVIRSHHGAIRVESSRHGGTCCQVFLRAISATAE